MTEYDAYKQAFWEALQEYPDLKFMLIGLMEAKNLEEWRKRWHFAHHEQARRFLRKNVRGYLRDAADGDAVKFLNWLMAEKGI